MTPPPVPDRKKRCKDLAATREVVAATRVAIGTAVTVMKAAAVEATVTVAASEIEAATVATAVAAVEDSVVEAVLKFPL